ncbi:MAG: glycosyltransferase [Clostridia bacterium]
MKKILVFGMTENPGGIENVIMNYYRNIDRNVMQFDFLCNTKDVAYEDEIKKLGGNVYRVTSRKENRKKFKTEMTIFFKEHAMEYYAIWVNICSLANIDYLKYAKKYKIKKRIVHSHNSQNMDSFIRGILHRVNRFFITKYATDYWSCSKEASEWFYSKKIINSKEIFLVNNAIDYEKFRFNEKIRDRIRNSMNLEEKTLVVGNVGRLHFQKNQQFVIDIFEEIYKKNNNSILFIIGEGPDREKLLDKIKEKKLEKCCFLLGVRSDINDIMQGLDVMLFPSLFEGLPLTVIEAQASNLPTYISKDKIDQRCIIDDRIIYQIPLEEKPKEWAKIVLDSYNKYSRKIENKKLFEASGYDINAEIETFTHKMLGEDNLK